MKYEVTLVLPDDKQALVKLLSLVKDRVEAFRVKTVDTPKPWHNQPQATTITEKLIKEEVLDVVHIPAMHQPLRSVDFEEFSTKTPKNRRHKYDDTSPNITLLSSVEDLELGVRLANCLHNEGYCCIAELLTMTEPKLLLIPNFGRKSLNELKEQLSNFGLRLNVKFPNWPYLPILEYTNYGQLKEVIESRLEVIKCHFQEDWDIVSES